MNSPRRPDGPPVRDGKPYSAIAHLAERRRRRSSRWRTGCARCGFSAPAIYFADLEQGLLIIEDLGDERVVAGDPPAPIAERYEAAVDVLLALHAQTSAGHAAGRAARRLSHCPRYDMDAFLIEAELLLDWYLPRIAARRSPDSARATFRTLWREALQPAIDAPPTWVLRDFHSPNLLWLPSAQRHRPRRPARFPGRPDGPGRLRPRLAAAGRARRRARADRARPARPLCARRAARPTPDFDHTPSSSRSTPRSPRSAPRKILGIFARLDMRDGKPQYLRHMPRVWGYLRRSLAHPALAPLNALVRASTYRRYRPLKRPAWTKASMR